MAKIILEKHNYGWAAWFFGVGRMPEDVELPLPFTSQAYLMTVANDMRERFPGATVFYRDPTGGLSRVAVIQR